MARYMLRMPLVVLALVACDEDGPDSPPGGPGGTIPEPRDWNAAVEDNANVLFTRGREIFRRDTFGSEQFFGDQLRLHDAIKGSAFGGVGPGLTARQALDLGLRVDLEQLPDSIVNGIRAGAVDLDLVTTTLDLLRVDAVIGLKGVFDANDDLVGIGTTCSLCHATVDDELTPGVGRRRDGWPNRDLDVGKILSLAPDLGPFQELLGVSRETVENVLLGWGPGKYDAQLNQDGKAFRPDGKSAATVLPAAFGMAGQSLHTYTGWGSVPYWNAYVANTQMRGLGTFYDPRLTDFEKFPLAERTGFFNKRDPVDRITSKLDALHFYQLAIPAPKPPSDSFDPDAARLGEGIFMGKAMCGTCHVPPLFSEPGWPMHTGAEIGIDEFQALRSPENMYRTTPLRGLFTRAKGGFYHDGRFPDLDAVVDHYEPVLGFTLDREEQRNLVEYLKSL